jgi:hypothetical protein
MQKNKEQDRSEDLPVKKPPNAEPMRPEQPAEGDRKTVEEEIREKEGAKR